MSIEYLRNQINQRNISKGIIEFDVEMARKMQKKSSVCYKLGNAFNGDYCADYQSGPMITLDLLGVDKIYQTDIKHAIEEHMDIVILGAQGSGKTTLLKAILNEIMDEYSFIIDEKMKELDQCFTTPKERKGIAYVVGELASDDDYNKFFTSKADVRFTTAHHKSISSFETDIKSKAEAKRAILVLQMSMEYSKKGIYSIGMIK